LGSYGGDDDVCFALLDEDSDGWDVTSDCDDDDNTVYSGADELCDGLDNNCNSVLPVDEIDNDSDTYVECTIDG